MVSPLYHSTVPLEVRQIVERHIQRSGVMLMFRDPKLFWRAGVVIFFAPSLMFRNARDPEVLAASCNGEKPISQLINTVGSLTFFANGINAFVKSAKICAMRGSQMLLIREVHFHCDL